MNTENNNTALVAHQEQPMSVSLFNNSAAFDHAQRIAKALASSDLVPTTYKGNISNTLIALEMSNRMGASPLAVMQNLNIIHGKPSFGSAFLIATINTCGRFAPLKYKVSGEGDEKQCIAWTTDRTGEVLEGPAVSIALAKKEGWFNKNGSKWQTMPELMLRYRAAAFFSRLYCPEISMGMQTSEEMYDVYDNSQPVATATVISPTPPSVEELSKKATPAQKDSAKKSVKKQVDESESATVQKLGTESVAPEQTNVNPSGNTDENEDLI